MRTASLRTRLTWLIIAVQVGVLIPLGLLSYHRERREMGDLLDGRLAQGGRTVGSLLEHLSSSSTPGSADIPLSKETLHGAVMVRVHKHNYEPEVGFQAYSAKGKLLAATSNFAGLPAPEADQRGVQDLHLGGRKWRTFTLQNQSGLVIRIGERYDNRNEITRALVMEHSFPLLIGLPLLALLAGFAVKRGLRPLELLTKQLAARTPGSRQPVAVDYKPREITPLVETLNQQLEQLEDTIEREHRFASDVAHELRTPLTASMIHIENALIAPGASEIEFSLRSAQQSLIRLARRVEQILALARLEAGAASKQRTRLNLISLATEVIEELAPMIVENDVAFSLNHSVDALWVEGHEAALTAMFRNLIENALRYTHQAGRVEVSIGMVDEEAVIAIFDDGPGIPAERRDEVFERFHRATETESPGYGLGLSIVQRAIELHGAHIELLTSPFGHGLQVRIHMSPAFG